MTSRSMTQRLFVYGTLAPGRPNEHVLANVAGEWQPATVTGRLIKQGWGAALGYPGLVLDEHGEQVAGFVFTSDKLPEYWTRLDEFEGAAYDRVLTNARLTDGRTVEAFVYTLSGHGGPVGRNERHLTRRWS
jgi:gamma-glutamylcyclotransferase (GGCT)/AIG2-like uncharacterized protein YtfP